MGFSLPPGPLLSTTAPQALLPLGWTSLETDPGTPSLLSWVSTSRSPLKGGLSAQGPLVFTLVDRIGDGPVLLFRHAYVCV